MNKERDNEVHILRLQRGQEVVSELEKYFAENEMKAAYIITCCGSLMSANLRMATCKDGYTHQIKTFKRYFEVLSMTGTLSPDGVHLHITLSDEEGKVFGGHVVGDLLVQTTMEIAIGEPKNVCFKREYDEKTGFNELTVYEQT